jgi:hypothetical protein
MGTMRMTGKIPTLNSHWFLKNNTLNNKPNYWKNHFMQPKLTQKKLLLKCH